MDARPVVAEVTPEEHSDRRILLNSEEMVRASRTDKLDLVKKIGLSDFDRYPSRGIRLQRLRHD